MRPMHQRLKHFSHPASFFVGAVIALVFSYNATAAEIYKTVDEHGNVTFSDVAPGKEAKPVTLSQENRFANDLPQAETAEEYSQYNPESEPPASYTSLTFTFPTQDQTVRENSGNVTFQLQMDPALQPDHQVQLLLNGQPRGTFNGASHTLMHMDRGTHTVSARIIAGNGKVLVTSDTITFHLQRYSSRF